MTISLRDIVGFHIGGRNAQVTGRPVQERRLVQGAAPMAVDPNGDYETGQMYVQGYLQAEPRHPLPVLLWHGGGMTGANWDKTPDGRPGWLQGFLHAGFDVYVSDAVERGRASWNQYPDIYRDEPMFRSKQAGWDQFRMGPPAGYATDPALCRPHPDVQFPIQAFDQFTKQWVPRWAEHEAMTLAAYQALLERVGPCMVVGHSQGGSFALLAAQRAPELVRRVVAIEPSGAPDWQDLPVRPSPHMVIWGDYIAEHPLWSVYRDTVDRYLQQLASRGSTVKTLDLPAQGMRGNTHFVMMDRNADAVLHEVVSWLSAP